MDKSLDNNQVGNAASEEQQEVKKTLSSRVKEGISQVKSAVKQIAAPSTPAISTATTTTTLSASTASSVTPSTVDSHSLGVYGIIKVTKAFYNNRADLAEQLAPIISFFGKITKKATKLNVELQNELALLYPPADEKSPQGQKKIGLFVAHLFSLVNDFIILFQPTENMDVSNEANALIKKIKTLLDEFEALNLEAMFNQYAPDSWVELKEKMLKRVGASMKQWLFKIEAKAIKIEAEMKAAYIKAGHEVSLNQFQSLSHSVKDGILLSMESALTLYKKFILMLDKLEVQFGFREEALLKMLTQDNPVKTAEQVSVEGPEKKDEKKPTDYTKSIISKFRMLSEHYKLLIGERGFESIELFPYSYSKQEARRKLKENITTDLNKKAAEYKNIGKNSRVVVTAILLSKNILDKVKLEWNEEQVALPDEINTAIEAVTLRNELSTQLVYLKLMIKPLKETIPKDDKKDILAYHKNAIAILRDLEFFLLEKERLEKIIAKSPPIDALNPPRQLQLAETMKLLKAQCKKIIDNARPYLNHESHERKQLIGFKVEIEKKKKQIEKIFNPIFIEHANKQFFAEKAALEKAAIEKEVAEQIEAEEAVNGVNASIKGEGEKKQDNISVNMPPIVSVMAPSAEESKSIENLPANLEEEKQAAPIIQTPVSVKINNPFTHFSYELLICIFRALDSINIIIGLTSSVNTSSKAKSPSEALAEDLTQANNIVGHAGEAITAYLKFSSYLKKIVLDEVAAGPGPVPVVETAEEKMEVVQAVMKEAEENDQVAQPVVTLEDIESKHDQLPRQDSVEDFVQAVPVVQVAKQSFMDRFKGQCSKKLDDKVTALLAYLEIQKNNWFGLDEETKKLVINIIEGFGSVIPQFSASYLDYLAPPTKKKHMRVAAENFLILYNLITDLDKLGDIISGSRIIIPSEILWYLNQYIKEIFVLIDQVEIYFYLKNGIILEELKKISIKNKNINVENFVKKIQVKLAGVHRESLSDDCYPYAASILAKRQEILEFKDSSDLVKKTIVDRPIAPSLAAGPQFPLAWRQLTELKSQTQLGLSTDLTKLKQSELTDFLTLQHDHKHSNSYLEDLDEIALKNENAYLLFESQLSEDLKAENNRNRVWLELDLAIGQLKAKRGGWFLSHRKLEKRIILLEEFRRILRKDGYTLKDASTELMSPKWKMLLSTDKALMVKLDRIEEQIPKDHMANKKITLRKKESKHPVDVTNPIFSRIELRIFQLKQSFFFPASNIKKKLLLKTLLSVIKKNKISFKNALQTVKQEFPEDAYLLYHGETGKMIRDIEQKTSNSRVIKSTMQSLRLKYFTSEAKFSSKKAEIKEAAEGVQLLQQIKASPHVPLNLDQEKRLKRIAPALLPSRQNRP